MAILWRKSTPGKIYEVRQAGQSRRLYTDGVFHTQYNPKRFLTCNVWDLLSLPALFLPPQQIRRVLMLGVGGGAVLQQLSRLCPQAQLYGIELDAVHLQIAQRFFLPKRKNIHLIAADAIDWIKRYDGPKFDIIIDDLFGGVDGEPQRVIEADKAWCKSLTSHLSKHGMLVFNFISLKQFKSCACITDAKLSRDFSSGFRLATSLYVNEVGVFVRQATTLTYWREQLQRHTTIAQEFARHQAKYKIRALHTAS